MIDNPDPLLTLVAEPSICIVKQSEGMSISVVVVGCVTTVEFVHSTMKFDKVLALMSLRSVRDIIFRKFDS